LNFAAPTGALAAWVVGLPPFAGGALAGSIEGRTAVAASSAGAATPSAVTPIKTL